MFWATFCPSSGVLRLRFTACGVVSCKDGYTIVTEFLSDMSYNIYQYILYHML